MAAIVCGCGSSGSTTGLTAGQQQGLVAQLEAARSKVALGDVAGTQDWLRKFRASIARLQRSGALTAAQARLLRIGAQRILARVKTDNPAPAPVQTPTATTPAPVPAPTPTPPPGKKHAPGQKKDKHGKGHGKKGD